MAKIHELMMPPPREDGLPHTDDSINEFQRPYKLLARVIYSRLMRKLACENCGYAETSLPWVGWQGPGCCKKGPTNTFTVDEMRTMVASCLRDFIGPDFGSTI